MIIRKYYPNYVARETVFWGDIRDRPISGNGFVERNYRDASWEIGLRFGDRLTEPSSSMRSLFYPIGIAVI